MAKVKDTFWGEARITGDEKPELLNLKKNWNNFNTLFWILLISHVVIKGIGSQQEVLLGFFFLQFLPIAAMVILMGYFAYRFSGRKSSSLYGLLGLVWFVIIGIFIGYFAIRHLRDNAIDRLK